RGAQRSLQGEFSRAINKLVSELTELRVFVEAALDFPEEEIDFLTDGIIARTLNELLVDLQTVLDHAQQGNLLREGIHIAIAGRPNAGKSSLLNALAGEETAIVTSIAGTTRDVLKERIDIDGLPIHIVDTAGLRSSPDAIEKEGMRRAHRAFEDADRVLLMVDCNIETALAAAELWPDDTASPTILDKVSVLRNKIDVCGIQPGMQSDAPQPTVNISVTANLGLDDLKTHIKEIAGYHPAAASQFTARRRHLHALQQAQNHLCHGQQQLVEFGAAELLAEDLRQTQQALANITGAVSVDELLGQIFSSFCIGK
ncbi:MAG: tRNA modification GTPase, partial [Pseudomonadales bacterium]